MSATHLLPELEAKRVALVQKMGAFLAELEALPEEALTRPQAEGRWSLLQVAEHLIIALRHVLLGLPPIEELKNHPRTFKNRVMFFVVLFVLRAGIKVPIPTKEMKPSGNMSLEQIWTSFNEVATYLDELLRKGDQSLFQRACFIHPVSGPIQIGQALTLANIHFDSHRRKVLLEQ